MIKMNYKNVSNDKKAIKKFDSYLDFESFITADISKVNIVYRNSTDRDYVHISDFFDPILKFPIIIEITSLSIENETVTFTDRIFGILQVIHINVKNSTITNYGIGFKRLIDVRNVRSARDTVFNDCYNTLPLIAKTAILENVTFNRPSGVYGAGNLERITSKWKNVQFLSIEEKQKFNLIGNIDRLKIVCVERQINSAVYIDTEKSDKIDGLHIENVSEISLVAQDRSGPPIKNVNIINSGYFECEYVSLDTVNIETSGLTIHSAPYDGFKSTNSNVKIIPFSDAISNIPKHNERRVQLGSLLQSVFDTSGLSIEFTDRLPHETEFEVKFSINNINYAELYKTFKFNGDDATEKSVAKLILKHMNRFNPELSEIYLKVYESDSNKLFGDFSEFLKSASIVERLSKFFGLSGKHFVDD